MLAMLFEMATDVIKTCDWPRSRGLRLLPHDELFVCFVTQMIMTTQVDIFAIDFT